MTLKVRALPDDGWPSMIADAIEQQQPIEYIIAREGYFSMVLSGGTTPEPVYAALAARAIPWNGVVLAQADERVVPEGDSRSNATMLTRAFAPALAAGADTYWMHRTFADPDPATRYDAFLRPLTLHVLVLGMGDDGHTASLFPGDGLVSRQDGVLAVPAAAAHEARLSLGRTTLIRAEHTHLILRGARKAAALKRLLAPTGDLELTPARIVHEMKDVTVYADSALLDAAGILA